MPNVPQVTVEIEGTTPLLRLWRGLRKYVNIFRVSLIERMAYRGDFLLGTILRFFPVITTILLWQAVFAGNQRNPIAGFDENTMIAYLLLIHISRMFSSMPGLSASIARDIREGTIKKYLIQPLDMIGYLLSYRAAHKTAYITTSAGPYACLFLLCSGYFVGLFPDPLTLLAYAA
jgi:ABC-2 type transport system permease protein